ncbi:MAG: hypothetical protein JW901_11175 [Dehalococcoidia bacterium]|nr:hypothetical protein [Dehalococcoidia bacterium]
MATKKILYTITGILAAGLMMTGLATTAAYADDGQAPPARGKLLERVAQILNIDKQQVVEAFQQATAEARQIRLNNMLDKWVADGTLTQDQAAQYKAWLAAKPAGVPGPFVGQNIMDRLLENGRITQAQYDAWKTWQGWKPAFELPKPERPAAGALPRRGLPQ